MKEFTKSNEIVDPAMPRGWDEAGGPTDQTVNIAFDKIPFPCELIDGVLTVRVPIGVAPAPMFTDALLAHAAYEVGKKRAAQITEHLQQVYFKRIVAIHMGLE